MTTGPCSSHPTRIRSRGMQQILIHRANLVRRDGWDQYRHLWSCGEVIGTALVLR